MEGTVRIWFTPQQRAELWERWKSMTWSHRYRYCGTRQGLATDYVQSFMSKAFSRAISVYMFFET